MAATFKRFVSAMFAVITIAACSKDIDERPEAPVVPDGPYTFLIGESSSRALLGSDERGRFGLWESGDKVGTLITSAGSTAVGQAAVTPGTPVSFSLYRQGGFAGGEEVRAYYPYNPATTGLDNVAFNIPTEQVQNEEGFDFDAMPMVSSMYEVTAPVVDNSFPVGELYFVNLASLAEFRVYSTDASYASETVVSIAFEAASPLAGSFTADISGMDIFDPSTLVIDGYSETSVTTSVDPELSVGTSLDDATSVFMALAPGTYEGAVIVTTDKAVYRYQLSSPQTFRRAVIRSLGVNLATCPDRTSDQPEPITVAKTIKQILTGMGQAGVANGTQIPELVFNEAITISNTGTGNNNGAVYSSGSDWRVYTNGGGNVIITAAEGYQLLSVKITHAKTNSSASAYEFEGPSSGKAMEVSGRSAYFRMISGNMKISRIEVTYIAVELPFDRAYLDCYEMPAVDATSYNKGMEVFHYAYWHQYDMTESNRKVITHTYEYDNRVYRNYTSCVDQEMRCPIWVAYVMHGGSYPNLDVGRGDFSESTSFDPGIPRSWQSTGSTSDYNSGNGYARGHLCASEDRQTCEDGNNETFYYTNQAPQWQNSFNGGIWGALEGDVQSKANNLGPRDSLYVVSGTLFDPLVFGSSNDGGQVARPSHFYKLLMLCSFDSSGHMVSASGAAYLYTNEAHSGVKYYNSAFKKSIDDVETLAGFDFFANIPADLQEDAEEIFHTVI